MKEYKVGQLIKYNFNCFKYELGTGSCGSINTKVECQGIILEPKKDRRESPELTYHSMLSTRNRKSNYVPLSGSCSYNGNTPLQSGYIYAPYIPMMTNNHYSPFSPGFSIPKSHTYKILHISANHSLTNGGQLGSLIDLIPKNNEVIFVDEEDIIEKL
jgi:hypothetical protein